LIIKWNTSKLSYGLNIDHDYLVKEIVVKRAAVEEKFP